MRMARCVVWTVLLVATGLPVLGAQTAKEAVPFRITGTVVNDRNGEPVPFCHMSASLVVTARGPGQRLGGEGGRGLRQEATEADADAKGRFVLKVPSEGRYRLSASARGFRVQMLEAHGTFSTAVALTRALPTHAVMFRVDEDATISGEVTDEAGEGVRQAQVKLYAVADPNRTPEERRVQMSTMAITDDQGHYELPAVAAGAYKLSVSARPWYATPNSPAPSGATAPSPDPSLDVVYPVTWYPSTDDATRGERIVVKYGEKKQMDFRLSPTATAHVRVSVPIEQPQSEGFRAGSLGGRPRLEQVLPDGLTDTATMQVNVSGGELEFGGLAPGTYRMVRPGTSTDGPQTVSIIHVAAGGTVTREAELREIAVTIRVDGDPTVVAGQVSLIDTATGQTVGRGRLIALGRPGVTAGPGASWDDPVARPDRRGDRSPQEAILQVPPGTYEVMVSATDSFLTGVTATGAEVTGRMVKIVDGNPHLLVHMAAGLASIEGITTRLGKPSSGAMVLLVPATLGNPANLGFERRAQTSTDGSFQFTNVIPGQYIVLAIDHGWGVNWRDQATLRTYLMQGEPLDLAAAGTAHPTLKAIAP